MTKIGAVFSSLALICAFVFSQSAMACSIRFKHPQYIHVVKLYGRSIEGMEYDVISDYLSYAGDRRLTVYQRKNEALVEIGVFENGELCTPAEASTDDYKCNAGYALNMGYFFDLDRRRVREAIYLQVDQAEPLEYRLKDKWVRNTRALRSRREAYAYHVCMDEPALN